MGKIKGHHIKVLAEILLEKTPASFSEDIEANKLKCKEMKLLEYSKKDRNKLAAELTNKVKRKNHPPTITARPRMSTGRGGSGYGRDRDDRGYGRDRERD